MGGMGDTTMRLPLPLSPLRSLAAPFKPTTADQPPYDSRERSGHADLEPPVHKHDLEPLGEAM